MTTDPYLTATIAGTSNFTSAFCYPSTLDTQKTDTSTTLVINAQTNDKVLHPYDKIILSISDYKAQTGTFSIVQGQATAVYWHNNIYSVAAGGVVSITKVTSTSLIGYFSFTTADGIAVTNGAFNVNRP